MAPKRTHKWAPQELGVLIETLRSEEFIGAHAPSLRDAGLPNITVREATNRSTEQHALCAAISAEILRRAGEHNGQVARPVGAIASRIIDARKERPALSPQEALAAFDVAALLGGSFPAASSSSSAADGADDGGPAAQGGVADAANEAEEAEAAAGGGEAMDVAADDAGGGSRGMGGGAAADEVAASGAMAATEEEEAYDDTYVAPVVQNEGGTRTIKFQTRILNQHLVCTLCMGYFNDACTIIECLHTFCRVCIMRHVRDSSLCPQCEQGLGANPRDLVRTDRTLQSIVDKVFPQFARQPERSAENKPSTAADEGTNDGGDGDGGEAGSGGVGGGEDGGVSIDGRREENEEENDDEHERSAERPRKMARSGGGGEEEEEEGEGQPAAEEAEISFSLHELDGDEGGGGEAVLEKPYLRTKAMLTIGHLRKYLARKMALNVDVPIELYCNGEMLEAGLTLEQIVRTRWTDEHNDLVLHYKVGYT
jgi:polycomb group RING finger protein 3